MTFVVSNTGPLLALAKVNALDIIFNLFDKIFVPSEVIKEILYPKEVIDLINSYVTTGKIIVLPVVPDNETYNLQIEVAIASVVKSDPKQWTPKQAKAEATTIYHTLKQNDSVLLMDDGPALSIAREKGVQYMRHLTIIKKCVEKGNIAMKKGLEILNSLEEKGYKYRNIEKLKETWVNG